MPSGILARYHTAPGRVLSRARILRIRTLPASFPGLVLATQKRGNITWMDTEMVVVEVSNRSGQDVETDAAAELAQRVLAEEGIAEGELGLAFVGTDEMRRLKLEHLGLDEVTDVLSFPIDGRDELPEGLPRQLGDAVLCPQVTGAEWRGPLVHGLLHLVGYEHGPEMERREARWRS